MAALRPVGPSLPVQPVPLEQRLRHPWCCPAEPPWTPSDKAIGTVMAGMAAKFRREKGNQHKSNAPRNRASNRFKGFKASSSRLFAALRKTELTETVPGPSRPLSPKSSSSSGKSNGQGQPGASQEQPWKQWLHNRAQKLTEKARIARRHASVLLSKMQKATKRTRELKPRKLAQSVWWSFKDSWSRIKPRQRILSLALALILLMTLWPSKPVKQTSDMSPQQSVVQLSPDEELRLQMLSQRSPSVVYVKGKPVPWISEKENQGAFVPGGSAWVFDGRHVVTSLKNIEQARRGSLKVVLEDRTELPARVIGVDEGSDLAVLELPKTAIRQFSVPALPLGPSASLRLGQDVILIGREATLDTRISKGVVYGLGQPLALLDADGHQDLPVQSCIQADVFMNSRNRGGPLLNSRGQVVGMAVGPAENQVGQAIPADSLQKHVSSIISSGHVTRPSLGMYVAPDGFAEKLGVTRGGVVVQEVIPGSPAKKAGLRAGDIIVSQGDNPIHRMDDLITVLEPFSPGDYFSLTVLRQTAGEGIFAPFSTQTYSQVDLTVRAESDLP